jgi:hypothetical protein
MKKSLYCFSSLPQSGASINFYDFLKKEDKKANFTLEEIAKILKNKKFKSINSNFFNFSSFADGAYPFYVKIDKKKKVEAIYFELTNNCGWGSSMFFERPDRLLNQIEAKKKMPKGYQIDMVVAPAMSINFKSRNRKSYYTFDDWVIDGKEFEKNKKTIKKKLGYFKVDSGLIVLDDTGEIDRLNEKIDVKKVYDKTVKQENYHGVDNGLNFDRVCIPVKKNRYPIYIHNLNETENELIKKIKLDNPKYGKVSPLFPIISIQNIEGCFLTKDEEGKLVFIKKEENKISEFLEGQIAKKEKNLKICQLDLDQLDSLKFVNKLNYKLQSIIFSDLKHIENWEELSKIKNVKMMIFSNCSINKRILDYIPLIESLNKKKINTIFGTKMMNYNLKDRRGNLEDEYGYYEGEYNTAGLPHGFGNLDLNETGDSYSGYFKNGKFHGIGSFEMSSGSWYLGEWKNGIQDGEAIFVSKDGFRYTGKFKNNKYHGKGKFFIETSGEEISVEHKEGVEIKK